MRRSSQSRLAVRALSSVAAFGLLTTAVVGSARPERPHAATRDRSVVQASGGLPVRFVENRGQFDPRVRFAASGHGGHLFLTDHDAVMVVGGGYTDADKKVSKPTAAVRMTAEGAADVRPEGVDVLPGRNNYFVGNDRSKWQKNVPAYAGVRYPKIYSGVDLVYHDAEGEPEYDFVVAPNADPSQIRLKFDGADSVSVEASGDLAIATGAGTIRQRRPTVYQETKDGARREIDGRYVATSAGRVGFALGAYDRSAPLVIDPVLAYFDVIGGTDQDRAVSIKVGPDGSAYIAGYTWSQDFPETVGLYPNATHPNSAFVAKIDPTGAQLVYSTVIAGDFQSYGVGVAIDSSGSAYLLGNGFQQGFPTTPSDIHIEDGTAFVAKLSPEGDALEYSVFFTESPTVTGIAVDSAGCAYLTGTALNLVTTPGAPQSTPQADLNDGFVLKLNAAGTAIDYATLICGSGIDYIYDIDVDASGSACVVGITYSFDLPVTPNAIQPSHTPETPNHFPQEGFVARLDPSGTRFAFVTYLGGENEEEVQEVRYGPSGDVYVCGTTVSPDFPTTAGAYDTAPAPPGPNNRPNAKGFVARLTNDGTSLVFSTYFGGSYQTTFDRLAVDGAGNAYAAGWTQTPDLPLTDPLVAGDSSGAYVAAFDATGSSLLFSAQVALYPGDRPYGVACDAAGDVYVAGNVFADEENGHDMNGFVAKLVNLSASAARVSDATSGDVFTQETDPASPNLGLWQYRSAIGNVYVGRATFTENQPGVRSVSSDKQKGRLKMKADLDYSADKASVDLRDLRAGGRRRIRTVLN